jgi:chemotaxis protein histidine kinase CheA
MATDAPAIPRVEETGLDRDDLTSAAEELGIDGFESWDDQQLFEQIGLQLGEISEDQLSDASEELQDTVGEVADAAEDATAAAQDTAEEAQDTAEDTAEEVQDTAEEAQDTAEDTAEEVQDTAEEAQDTAEDTAEEAQDTAEEAQDTAEDTAEEAQDTAEEAQDTAEDTAEEAQDTAEDTAEEAQDTAEDTAEEAQDTAEEAQDTAEDTAEEAQDTAEDTAEEAQDTAEQVSGKAEYRPEDDPRPNISSVLNIELGPVDIDLLGLEIHLNRIHAAVMANPTPSFAILGKLLAPLGSATSSLGLDSVTDKATDAVDATLDMLPSPSVDGGDEDDEDGEDEGGGVLSTLTEPLAAAGRLIKNLVTNTKDAAGEAKEAGVSGTDAVRNAASGNTLRAMKHGKDAVSHATDAAKRTATLASDS